MTTFGDVEQLNFMTITQKITMTEAFDTKIYILYENEEWLAPLTQALDARQIPYAGMKVIEGGVALDKEPPQGVFFNRLSASAHTRGHTGSVSFGGAILAWLEHHKRTVVNGRHVIDLEVRKFDQYARLQSAGIQVPKTIATTGKTALIEAAESFNGQFIVKPNRGGKGLGVRLFEDVQALKEALGQGKDDFASVDGIQLVQEYIEGRTHKILRNEFIGGKYYYSVEVDTEGGFELCPADSCSIDAAKPSGEKFRILGDFRHPLADQYEAFLKDNNIEIAAFESIEAKDGTLYTYDINTNANYNRAAENACGSNFDAYGHVAEFLKKLLNMD